MPCFKPQTLEVCVAVCPTLSRTGDLLDELCFVWAWLPGCNHRNQLKAITSKNFERLTLLPEPRPCLRASA